MNHFECQVKDLEPKPSPASAEPVQKEQPVDAPERPPESPKCAVPLSKQHLSAEDVKNTLFAKITEEKNVRLILLIVIAYLITSSTTFIEILGNSFPYLVEGGVANLTGKIFISVLIGVSVVIFKTFFSQAP